MTKYTGDYKTEQIPLRYVPLETLRALTEAILTRTDLKAEDAVIIADALITSELRNLQGQGQGVRRVKAYVDRVKNHYIDPHAPFEIVKQSPALALVDAHNAPGTVVAVKAMRLAIEKAKVCGVGTVVVRHSTHFGSASYSASEALKHGCIGVSMTNAGPEMAPWGGIDAVIGTNPWAVAIPTGDDADAMPIILDMALTMAGKGMMGWLLRDGKKMPTTWAITKDGRFTDEPAEAMDGTLLPMGEYKGAGLSVITDVLTGVLSGSGAFGTIPYSNTARQDVAHQFIAYDIDWFMPRAAFYADLAQFVAMLRASRTRPDVTEILLPGELEWRRMQEKKVNGVPVDPIIYAELKQSAAEVGVTWPIMPNTALGRAVAQRAQHWLTTPPPDSVYTGSSTSAEVRAAVQQAMADHLCDHYTRRPGIAPLCKAIAAQIQAHGLEADADNGVVVTGGVDETRYVALHALAPGKTVYIAQPGPGYHAAVLALAGIAAQPLDVRAELPAVDNALLLVDPAQLDADAQSQLAEWAVAHNVTVIADESELAFFEKGHRPFAQHPGLAERTLTLGSFKGLQGLAHWQVAWFAGPKKIAVPVRDLKQAMTISSPAPAQYAALAAVKQKQEAGA